MAAYKRASAVLTGIKLESGGGWMVAGSPVSHVEHLLPPLRTRLVEGDL